MADICEWCEKPIEDGQPVAYLQGRQIHARCGKVGKMHPKVVKMERCDNCGANKIPGEACFQCGVGPRIGG